MRQMWWKHLTVYIIKGTHINIQNCKNWTDIVTFNNNRRKIETLSTVIYQCQFYRHTLHKSTQGTLIINTTEFFFHTLRHFMAQIKPFHITQTIQTQIKPFHIQYYINILLQLTVNVMPNTRHSAFFVHSC